MKMHIYPLYLEESELRGLADEIRTLTRNKKYKELKKFIKDNPLLWEMLQLLERKIREGDNV